MPSISSNFDKYIHNIRNTIPTSVHHTSLETLNNMKNNLTMHLSNCFTVDEHEHKDYDDNSNVKTIKSWVLLKLNDPDTKSDEKLTCLMLLFYSENWQNYDPNQPDIINKFRVFVNKRIKGNVSNITTDNDKINRMIEYTWLTLSYQDPSEKLAFLTLVNKQNNKKSVNTFLKNKFQNDYQSQTNIPIFLDKCSGLCLATANYLIQGSNENPLKLNKMAWATLKLALTTAEYNFLEALNLNPVSNPKSQLSNKNQEDMNHLRKSINNINNLEVDSQETNLENKINEEEDEIKPHDQSPLRVINNSENQFIYERPSASIFVKEVENNNNNNKGGAVKFFVQVYHKNSTCSATVPRDPANDNIEYAQEEEVTQSLEMKPELLNLLSPQLATKQTRKTAMKPNYVLRTVGQVASTPEEKRLDKYLQDPNLQGDNPTQTPTAYSKVQAVKTITNLTKATQEMGKLGVTHRDLHKENIKVIGEDKAKNPIIVFFDFGLTLIRGIHPDSTENLLEDWKYLLDEGNKKRKATTFLSTIFAPKKVVKHFPIRKTLEASGVSENKIKRVKSLTSRVYREMESVKNGLDNGRITNKEFHEIIKEIVKVMNACIELIIFDDLIETNLGTNRENYVAEKTTYYENLLNNKNNGMEKTTDDENLSDNKSNTHRCTYTNLIKLLSAHKAITPDTRAPSTPVAKIMF